MTALQQKDLFSKRWRKVRPPDPSELQIHISLVAQLKHRCRAGVIFFHVPNGEQRDKRTAAKLKAMGVLPGVADLIFLWARGLVPCVLFLELKARGRGLTDEQKWFRDNVVTLRCYFECADNIDDALKILAKYGLLRGA
jgi:hypothetical protein